MGDICIVAGINLFNLGVDSDTGAGVMPIRSKHPCNKQGCNALTSHRYCPMHEKQSKREDDALRLTSTQRGYNTSLSKIRLIKLSKDPLCERCLLNAHSVMAVLVHHKDRNPRNNAEDNLESLCRKCHDEEHKDDIFKKR